ncbi:hypothetical protein PROFUN_00827 [Planoprotostelium fungivorum]|uniref:Translocon-associated protein subunit beta n=1 Tax=Planoprotostelium fungivorum TaxID=1890364 RepID=A0A2P6P009_9EUKA|nr:hypothetical protein PROFUN_00827 [Planoprotostelium fungivorum]
MFRFPSFLDKENKDLLNRSLVGSFYERYRKGRRAPLCWEFTAVSTENLPADSPEISHHHRDTFQIDRIRPRTTSSIVQIMFKLIFALLALTIATQAHLIVHKSVLSENVILEQDLHINVQIFNVGENVAYDINLNDTTWAPEVFHNEEGLHVANWEKLGPGESINHTYTLKPLMAGGFENYAAYVSYKYGSENAEVQYVRSTSFRGVWVETASENARRLAPRYREWFIFIILVALLSVPAYLVFGKKKKATTVRKGRR